MKAGMSIAEIHESTAIDPWFLDQIAEIIEIENELRTVGRLAEIDTALLRRAKQVGFSDRQLAKLLDAMEIDVRAVRKARGVTAVFKAVDTCAAEFEAITPYYYSTYEDEDETPPGTAINRGS